jgi:hypothetical protein
VLASNITDAAGHKHAALLYVGASGGSFDAIDAVTGAVVWSKVLGQGTFYCGAVPGSSTQGFAISNGAEGTAVIDRANGYVYAPDGIHRVHALNLRTGVEKPGWPVDVGVALAGVNSAYTTADQQNLRTFIHTGLNLVGSHLYLGTSSTCDISPWEGRVVDINAGTGTIAHTFFTVYNQAANNPNPKGGPFGGGGVWGWGGVSADASGNVYTGVGNADTNSGTLAPPPPFQTAPGNDEGTIGYAEEVLQLSSNLVLKQAVKPGFPLDPPYAALDLDFSGTPVIFSPNFSSCQVMASQGKGGALIAYNTANFNNASTPLFRIQLAAANDVANYIGNPAFSPITGYLYAAVASAQSDPRSPPVAYPPGMVALTPNCSGSWGVAWNATFGPDSSVLSGSAGNTSPRTSPTVTSGGVVFMGTPDGNLWALDAVTGAVLNSGTPILQTGQGLRMAPIVDGQWLFLITEDGILSAMTINSAYASAVRRSSVIPFYANRSRPSFTRASQ